MPLCLLSGHILEVKMKLIFATLDGISPKLSSIRGCYFHILVKLKPLLVPLESMPSFSCGRLNVYFQIFYAKTFLNRQRIHHVRAWTSRKKSTYVLFIKQQANKYSAYIYCFYIKRYKGSSSKKFKLTEYITIGGEFNLILRIINYALGKKKYFKRVQCAINLFIKKPYCT